MRRRMMICMDEDRIGLGLCILRLETIWVEYKERIKKHIRLVMVRVVDFR